MPIAVINSSSKRPDSHFGTHLDAPLHFVENGKAVHQLELEQLIGEAHVAEVRNRKSIGPEDLKAAKISSGQAVNVCYLKQIISFIGKKNWLIFRRTSVD